MLPRKLLSMGIGEVPPMHEISTLSNLGKLVRDKTCERCGVPCDEVSYGAYRVDQGDDPLDPKMAVEFKHHGQVDVLLLSHCRLAHSDENELLRAVRFKPFAHIKFAEGGGVL